MPRGRWAIAAGVAATVAVAIASWLAVSAAGAARESARLRALISPPATEASQTPPDTDASQTQPPATPLRSTPLTFKQLGGRLDNARATLGRIKAYATPFRLAPWFWGLMPFRGGDLRELPHLIDYSDSTLTAVASVYDLADGGRVAIDADRRSATKLAGVSTIRAAARYIDQHSDQIIAARMQLHDAGSLATSVDRQRLSQGVGDAFDRVESVRGSLEAVVDFAAALTPAVADLDRILKVAGAEDLPVDTPAASHAAASQAVDVESIARLAESFPQLAAGLREAGATLAPYVGRNPQTVDAIVDYGIRLAAPVAGLLRATVDAGHVAAEGLPDDARSAAALEGVLKRIEASAAEAAGVAIRSDRPEIASGVLDSLSQQLRRVALSAFATRELLGYNGRRQILVLGQDDDELRPAGGFIGTVWAVEFDHGRLVSSRVQSSYAVDEGMPVERWMRSPPGFAVSFDADVIPFRDQNWWPDFTYSAARLRETYERGQGARPHAVVAINQRSLEAILSAIGPIEILPGRSVDAEGLRSFLRQGIEPAPGAVTPSDIDPRRYAAQLLGAAIIRRVSEGGSLDLFRLSISLNRVTSEGDLLIDVEAAPARAALRELGWDGSLASFPADGWYWVDSNAYSPKISQQIVRAMRHSVEIQTDGSAIDRLTVRYENPVEAPEAPLEGTLGCVQPAASGTPPCYWVYARLYLPAGSQIVSAPGFQTPSRAARAARSPEGSPATAALANTLHIEPTGHRIEVSGLAVVAPGDSEEWEFVYRVPEASRLLGTGERRYSSLIERQPGTPPTTVTVEIAVPAGACITNVEGVGGKMSLSWSLTRDHDLSVDYSFNAARCP
ncbi:MAG: DUF4012 domain-containing protein [Chloroflexi bacterium]|nr:DUF4012 domain-containing protein [Chloroflexota bacterium]